MEHAPEGVLDATFRTVVAGVTSTHRTGGYRQHAVACDNSECLRPYPGLSGDLQYEELRHELDTAMAATQQTVAVAQRQQEEGELAVAKSRTQEQAKTADFLLSEYPTHLLLTVKQDLALTLAIENLFADRNSKQACKQD